jgi:integrase
MAKKPTGIEVRHSRTCRTNEGGNCNCAPTYRASVWSRRDGKKIRKTFMNRNAALLWRADNYGAVKRNTLRASTGKTLREAADEWIAGAETGAIRKRNGERYKPSAIRSYRAALDLRVLREFGARKLSDISPADLQAFVEQLQAEGLDGSTIRNMLMPLRAIYRRACRPGGEIAANPTLGLELPAATGKRERIAPPDEASRLLAALGDDDRPIYATAFFAGLRLGELRALRWENVDLARGEIRVRDGWDARVGRIEPKSQAGIRDLPLMGELREHLTAHKVRTRRESGLVFGRTETLPFSSSTLERRSKRTWKSQYGCGCVLLEGQETCREHHVGKLAPIGLHECRHTFASLLIEAGVSAKRVSVWVGHSSVAFTLDRYAKLFEKREAEEMRKVDDFYALANSAARIEQVERGPVAGQ